MQEKIKKAFKLDNVSLLKESEVHHQYFAWNCENVAHRGWNVWFSSNDLHKISPDRILKIYQRFCSAYGRDYWQHFALGSSQNKSNLELLSEMEYNEKKSDIDGLQCFESITEMINISKVVQLSSIEIFKKIIGSHFWHIFLLVKFHSNEAMRATFSSADSEYSSIVQWYCVRIDLSNVCTCTNLLHKGQASTVRETCGHFVSKFPIWHFQLSPFGPFPIPSCCLAVRNSWNSNKLVSWQKEVLNLCL